ncbi:inovirus Gp2 family protein [Salmonella enterica subsp. enterica serovar Westhampton]|nr:inovirus Gp2 family protein [Salmonella enterica subsp. enterica serovar Westhampton]EHX0853275.1 inovirus-type Gp2 protein [Salmonella enterica subsp. enterica]MLA12148.1 inovirus Gp2 family protein [Salmonella enterica subsp. enterica]
MTLRCLLNLWRFIPEKPIYRLLSKEGMGSEDYCQLIYRASYLAKERTTVKRVGERSFSTSQK